MDKLISTNVSGAPLPINTTISANNTSVSSQVAQVPQIQTTVQDNRANAVSIINAPFVQVTSVNGMTGDVKLNVKVEAFTTQYYQKGSAVTHNGGLYIAKRDFTASTFNPSDWDKIEAQSVQSDWNMTQQSDPSFIKNKPTRLLQIDPSYVPYTVPERDKLAQMQIYTQSDQMKLHGIEANAQRNVPQMQPDWAETSTSSASFIKNKPQNLVQDRNYVHTDNNFTTAEKTKLARDFVEAGKNAINERFVNLGDARYHVQRTDNFRVNLPGSFQRVLVPGLTLSVPMRAGEKWRVWAETEYLSNGDDSGGELDLQLYANNSARVASSTVTAPIPSMARCISGIYTTNSNATVHFDIYLISNQRREVRVYSPVIWAERWG